MARYRSLFLALLSAIIQTSTFIIKLTANIQTNFHSSKHFSDYLQLCGFSQHHPITPSVKCHMDFGRILLSVKNVLKCININNIQFWKIYISQNTKMFVLAHYIFCIGMYSTIHKFIIIWISFNQFESINRINEQYVISR